MIDVEKGTDALLEEVVLAARLRHGLLVHPPIVQLADGTAGDDVAQVLETAVREEQIDELSLAFGEKLAFLKK
jgi:hypothetical protein